MKRAVFIFVVALFSVSALANTEEALLRAIQAHPGEDTPRLMYADYLEELGGEANLARAEIIRIEIRMQRASHPSLQDIQRRFDLHQCYDKQWLSKTLQGAIDRKDVVATWERGFLSQVRMSNLAFMDGTIRDAVLELPLLARLEIFNAPDILASEAMRLPSNLNREDLSRIRSLRVPFPTNARAIDWSRMPSLVELRLDGISIGDQGIRDVVDSIGPQLINLSVQQCGLTNNTVEYLSSTPRLGRLEALYVSRNPGITALGNLGVSTAMPNLRYLGLGGCSLSSNQFFEFGRSPRFRQLHAIGFTELLVADRETLWTILRQGHELMDLDMNIPDIHFPKDILDALEANREKGRSHICERVLAIISDY